MPSVTRQNFQQNDHVRVRNSIGDLKVTVVGPYDTALDLWTVAADAGITFVISGHVLERRDPQWKAGDVIVVKHQGYGPAYTYVRSTGGWLTEHGSKSDEIINKWYRAGWVTPKLQSGGEPFDPARL